MLPRSSPKRGPKNSPSKRPAPSSASKLSSAPVKKHQNEMQSDAGETPVATSPDRRVGQRIGMRLRNLLKLPKAHKWVCYEWFYSNIDK